MATQSPTTKTKKLPIKRRKFVEALVGPAQGNKTLAAKMAGYGTPETQGSRLSKFVDVQKAVEERLARGSVRVDEISARLALMACGAIPTKTVVETGLTVGKDGEAVPVEKERHEYAMEAATNTQAKIAGLLKDKESTTPVQVNVAVISQLPDGPKIQLLDAFMGASNE